MKALTIALLCCLEFALPDNGIFGDALMEQVDNDNEQKTMFLRFCLVEEKDPVLGRRPHPAPPCILCGGSWSASLCRANHTGCSCCLSGCCVNFREGKFGWREDYKDRDKPFET